MSFEVQLHPNFTETGYEVLDIPPVLFKELKQHFHDNYPKNVHKEHEVPGFILL